MSEKIHKDKPEVYALRQNSTGWQISRRDFLKAAGIGAAAVGIGMQCGFVKPVSADDSLEELCRNAQAHQNRISDLKISPDGRYLFSADPDSKMKCWDLETHTLLHSAADSGKVVTFDCIGMLADMPVVYKADNGQTIRAIELPELKAHPDKFNVGLGFSELIGALAASQDGDLFGVCGKNLFRLSSGGRSPFFTDQVILHEFTQDLKDLAVLDGGDLIFVQLDDGCGTYDPDTEEFREITDTAFRSFSVTPDEDQVLIWDKKNNYRLLSLEDGSEVWAENLSHDIIGGAVSPDGNTAVLLCGDNVIRLISMKNGAVINILPTGEELRPHIAIAPDGSQCAVGVKNSILFLSLPDMKILGCPVDLSEMKDNSKGVKITGTDPVSGETVTYTLPCGAPIPAGAVCVCNCVAGSVPSCSCVGHKTCSCVGHVSCSCVGHTVTYHYWHPN